VKTETNVYLPMPWSDGETQGSYFDRLEQKVIEITKLASPSKDAIAALAYIAMEAPADFDSSSFSVPPPSVRMRQFLALQPEELRTHFQQEAMKQPRGKKDRVRLLLRRD
jgi:hypothetical protein